MWFLVYINNCSFLLFKTFIHGYIKTPIYPILVLVTYVLFYSLYFKKKLNM